MDWDSVIGKNGLDNPQPPQQVFEILENTKPDGAFYNPPPQVDENGNPKPVFDTSTKRLSDITKMDFKPRKMFVDRMLTTGLTVIAGNPKSGKSLLSFQLALSVANEEPFLEMNTTKTGVLYFDFESDEQSTHERFIHQKHAENAPDNFFVKYESRTLEGSPVTMFQNQFIVLLEQMITEIKATYNVDIGLIVIDIITLVKGGEKRSRTAYENDYGMFGVLNRFALDREIAILAVTHLHKQNPLSTKTDWIERITGSMGLVGASSNIWGLFAKENPNGDVEAELKTKARYLPSNEFTLLRRKDSISWEMISNNPKEYAFKTHPFIKFLISSGNVTGTAGEISLKYLEYCRLNNLYPRFDINDDNGNRLHERVIAQRFTGMVKALTEDIYLIEYELHTHDTSRGKMYYFEKYVSD